jgi:ABC-type amino acid transport substrate-binding protein
MLVSMMIFYHNKNYLFLNIVFFGVFWCFCLKGYAQQQTIVVGLEDLDYLPYYQSGIPNKEPTGYGIELIKLFANKYNYSVQFKTYPVRRLLSNLLAGKIDFKYPDSPNWSPALKKSHRLIYSDTTVEIIDGIVTMEKYHELLLDEFVRLGSIRGFKPWPYIGAIQQREMTLMEASSMDQLISQLIKGRVQGIYININVAIDYAANNFNGIKLYWNNSLPFGRDNFSLSTVKHPLILEEFNAFLIKYNDEILLIKQKYNLEYSPLG